jgi:hypothetical protein
VSWCKLADLNLTFEARILTVRPKWRTYLRQSDVVYDWHVGHPFVVTDGPYQGYTVDVTEVRNLKRDGYTAVHIHYNIGDVDPHVEVTL